MSAIKMQPYEEPEDDLPFPSATRTDINEEDIERLKKRAEEDEKKYTKIGMEMKDISWIMISFFNDLRSINTSKQTLKTYNTHLNGFYKYLEGFQGFDDNPKYLSNAVFKEYSSYLLYTKKISNHTALSYLRTVKHFFYWCMENEYIEEFKIKLPKVQESVKEIYTDEELKLLLKKPNIKECTFTEFRIWAFENFLVSTGQRLETALNVKIRDIDFKNKIVSLNITKNNKAHTVEISKEMADILDEYLKVRKGDLGDFLFCNSTGDKWNIRTCQEQVKKYNENRGVSKSGIHTFRHTFAKNFILNGGNPFVLQRILDHESLDTTLTYAKLFGKDLKGTSTIYNPIKDAQDKQVKKEKISMKSNKKK